MQKYFFLYVLDLWEDLDTAWTFFIGNDLFLQPTPVLFPENFSRVGWKKLEYFWKKLEKQGRPPLKNENSSDLGHFEIKFGRKGGKLFLKKRLCF